MAILRIIFLLSAFVVQGLAESGKSPNIVFIFGDDLGWGDVSFHNSKQIPTPNIDAIARDGIILNQYYVQPICSPSRGALMTGKYPIRIGFQHLVIRGPQPWGLPLKEKILPEYLKELGYATHAVGKWHLGFYESEYLPQNRGFDSYFGYWNGEEDYFTHVARDMGLSGLDLHDNCENVWRFNGTYGTDLYTSMAKKIIRNHSKNNKNQPLFLYLAQQAPHGGNRDTYPLQAPEKYTKPLVGIDPEGRHTFAGMVSALDFSVGEVFAALDKYKMLDDTIFIFSTDNGGAVEGLAGTYGSNYPLRGSKQTLWEGGVRGVGFIWSSRLRQRSRIYNELMHVTDWLPTLLSAVGGSEALELLKDDTIDGVDHWPSLTQDCPSSRQEDLLNIDNIQNRGPEALELLEVGTIDEVDWKPLSQDCPSPRQEVLLNIDNIQNTTAIRQNNFKLISGTFQNGKFDGHFNQTGMPMGYYPSSFTPQQEILYQQTYNRYLKRAKAAKVLQEKYGRDPMLAASCLTPICKLQLEINCGVRLPVSPCNVAEAPCLFDLSTDPCELNNLAEILPEVVQQLQDSMNKYIPYIVPFGEKPFDPKADPALHGDAWVPWQSSCCEPRGVCMSDEMKLI